MKKLIWISLLTLVFAYPQSTSIAQSVDSASAEDLKQEVNDLRTELAKVRKDLDEVLALAPIKSLIAENRPVDVVMDVTDHPFLGSPTSPLTIVEFSDFQCPYCGRHARDTFPNIKEKFVDTGKLKYVFVDYPLPNHPFAQKAAEAAHCAADQDHFWEMHDELFSNQGNLAESALPGHAAAIGLDETQFSACLDSGKYSGVTQAGRAEGDKLNVRGTPSFGLGYTSEDGETVHVVKLIRGAQPLAAFEDGINELLDSDAGSD
jgi:protein-disulfide isomerase